MAGSVTFISVKTISSCLGCFAISANNVTADFTVTEGKMTATRCIAACNELGYGWAGLQNRERQCFHMLRLKRADNQNVDVPSRTQGRTLPLLPPSTIVPFHVMAMPTRDAVDGDMSICTIHQPATHHRPMELTTVYPLFQAIRVG
jgi:hypothetical protein